MGGLEGLCPRGVGDLGGVGVWRCKGAVLKHCL